MISSISLGILTTSSCWRDDLDPDVLRQGVDSKWGAPFFKTKLNIEDIDETSEFLSADPDGLLRAVYRQDTLATQKSEDFFDVPSDQPDNEVAGIKSAGKVTAGFNFLSTADARLQQILLHEGQINYAFPDTVAVGTIVKVTLGTATLANGDSATFLLERTSSSYTGSFDVSGMDFSFTGSGNELELSVEVIAAPGVPDFTAIPFTIGFSNLSVQQIEAYFGNRVLALPSSTQKINMRGLNQYRGAISLSNPEIKVKIWNPLGVSFELIPVLNGIAGGKSRLINLPPIVVNQPTMPGNTEYSEIVFNSSNSDLSRLLEELPEEIFMQGTIIVNPGQDSTQTNFASRDDEIRVGLEINIPLIFSAPTLVLTQSLSNFSVVGGLPQEFTSLGAKVTGINSFPFDATVKVFFKDSQGDRLDSIVVPVLQAADVDGEGRVTAPTDYTFDLDFDESSMDIITAVNDVDVEVSLGTVNEGQDQVAIYTDYTFEIRLSLRAGVNVKIPQSE
ncbi:MAG: hypothetical protein JJU02_02295 [Cryomorphaceae bacterium]|nr:hypothetical protein [Cryomorphaceae bacterium]